MLLTSYVIVAVIVACTAMWIFRSTNRNYFNAKQSFLLIVSLGIGLSWPVLIASILVLVILGMLR